MLPIPKLIIIFALVYGSSFLFKNFIVPEKYATELLSKKINYNNIFFLFKKK